MPKPTIADIKRQLRAYGHPVGIRTTWCLSLHKPWLKKNSFQCFIVLPPETIHPDYAVDPYIEYPNHKPRYLFEGQTGSTWMEAWLKLRNELYCSLAYTVEQVENERKNR